MLALGVWLPARLHAQDEVYTHEDSRRLQIRVHIIGEVKEPGEYLVFDNTDVLELISKAGGPTEFGNLGRVRIRRSAVPIPIHDVLSNGSTNGDESAEKLLHADLMAYLNAQSDVPPPVLRPGDVVTVPSNSWRTWRRVFSMVRDVAVIASVYLLYLRVN